MKNDSVKSTYLLDILTSYQIWPAFSVSDKSMFIRLYGHCGIIKQHPNSNVNFNL